MLRMVNVIVWSVLGSYGAWDLAKDGVIPTWAAYLVWTLAATMIITTAADRLVESIRQRKCL